MKLIAELRAGRREALKPLLVTLALTMLAMACLAGLILLLASDLLASLYGEPSLGLLFKLGALLLFLSLLGGFLAGTLQGFQRIDALAVLGPTKAVAMLLATLLLLPGFGLVGLLLASIGAEVLAGLLAVKSLRPVISPDWSSQRASPSWALLDRAVRLALPIFLNGLTLWGTPWLVRSYLAGTNGYAAVGFYQVADALSRALLFLPGAVAVPFVPAVSELAAGAPDRVSGLAQATLRLTVLVTLPAALFLFLGARPLLELLYGASYAAAGSLAALLVPAAFLQAVSVIVWSLLVGSGRIWIGFLIQSAGQLLLVASTLLLVPPLGLIGLGVSHIVASGASLSLGLSYLILRFGVTLRWGREAVALGLLGWLCAWVLEESGQAGLLPALLVSLGIAAWEGFRLPPPERARLKALVHRLRPRHAGDGSGRMPQGE
jgi:O-antigen/teichoic acid export membrane protein